MKKSLAISLGLAALLSSPCAWSAGEGKSIQINSQVADTVTRRTVAAVDQQGEVAKLFSVQKKLVYKILEQMKVDAEKLPEKIKVELARPHTSNFKAFVAYSVGLDLTDQGRFQEARAAFGKAAKLDPGFQQARIQERRSPFRQKSLQEMSTQALGSARRTPYAEAAKPKAAPPPPAAAPAPPPPPPAQADAEAEAAAQTDAQTDDAKTVAESPGESPGDKVEAAGFEVAFDEAVGEVTRLTEGVATLAKAAAANPEKAPELLREAIANGVDTDIALETALLDMRGVDKKVLKAVLESAVEGGLNPMEARRVVKELRSSGGCR